MTQPARMVLRELSFVTLPFVMVALAFDLIHAFPFGLMYDDGYFYAGIGYHLGTLGRVTFDGIHTTSGFHLAWGALLGAVSAVVGLISEARPVHIYFHQVLFCGLALVVTRSFARGAVARIAIFALILLGSLLMETLLLSLLLLVLSRLDEERDIPATSRPAFRQRAAAALAFLVPLVRIDATVILVVYAALCALVERDSRSARRILIASGLGLATQLFLMKAFFGHWFSVSAWIKAGAMGSVFHNVRAGLLGPEPGVVGYALRSTVFLALVAATILCAIAGRADRGNRRRAWLAAGGIVFAATHGSLQVMPFWCYLPAYLLSFHAIHDCRLDDPLRRRLCRGVIAGVAVIGVAFMAHKVRLHVSNSGVIRGARDFVDRIADHVPPEGRVLQVDGAGFVGFFSGRHIVGGDGLVNTYDYARRLRGVELQGWLREQDVCYLVTNRRVEGQRLLDFGGLVVGAEEATEVLRSHAFGRFPTTDFVLFALLREGCPGPALPP